MKPVGEAVCADGHHARVVSAHDAGGCGVLCGSLRFGMAWASMHGQMGGQRGMDSEGWIRCWSMLGR